MFDIGWSEMAVIAVVALIVIGPRDLPKLLYTAGKLTAKARATLHEFQQGLADMAREAELDEVRQKIDQARNFNPVSELDRALDPTGDVRRSLDPAHPVQSTASLTTSYAPEAAPAAAAEPAGAAPAPPITEPAVPAAEPAPDGVERAPPNAPAANADPVAPSERGHNAT